VYSIVELIYRPEGAAPPNAGARLAVDNQEFTGFPGGDGAWHFLFSPKQVKKWSYQIVSDHPGLNGQTGGFMSTFPKGDLQPSPDYPNWWTDDPNPRLREGDEQGAKTVSRWREEYLHDFASHMLRCKAPK
jgi:hypothetical protein